MESQIIAWVLDQGGIVIAAAMLLYGARLYVKQLQGTIEKLNEKNEELNERLMNVYANTMIDLTGTVKDCTDIMKEIRGRLDASDH